MAGTGVAPLLGALADALGAKVSSDDELDTYKAIFKHLPLTVDPNLAAGPSMAPACANLDVCYRTLESEADPLTRAVGDEFRKLEPLLPWLNYDATDDSPCLDVDYADAIIVGQQGLAHSDLIEIGVSVMSPHTFYPDHNHIERELYIALSPGQWRQQAHAWTEPGIGNLVYNYSNVVHAMRTEQEPLLAIWCVPLQE